MPLNNTAKNLMLDQLATVAVFTSLHTADPGEAGDQTTNEATYTSYARVAVARSAGGWAVSGNNVDNVAAITFPKCTGGSNNIAFWGIGTDSSGAGKLLYKGSFGIANSPPLAFTGATDDNITVVGHTLAVSDRVVFYAEPGQALPTGITEGVLYWVKTVASNVITISTTDLGATLDISAAGSGKLVEAVILAVSNQITPNIAIGELDVTEH